MRKRNKKVKLKKKVLFLIIIFLLVVLGLFSYYIYNAYESNLLKSIKNSYSKCIKINKDTNLYDKDKNIIANVKKGFELELENYNIITINNKYFKIKDTNYYVNYKDINKCKEKNNIDVNTHYLDLNKNIEIENESFYKDNKEVLKINKKLSLPVKYMDKDNYYINYMNNILSVKKNDSVKLVDNINNDEKEASYVSVLLYDNVNPTCNNYNCIPTNNLKNQISEILEKGYYTINKTEYINYINGYVRLKEKAILIITNNINDEINNISKELKINIEKFGESDEIIFKISNNKSTPNDDKSAINAYQIKSYSTLNNVIKMANGENVIESEPVKAVTKKAGVPVLNYHFFYDPEIGENCNEAICLTTQKFREHLEYLKNNNYKTLTIKDFTQWIYGEIEIPEKSVLITIDDGAMGTGKHNGNKLIPLLEEYKMHATLFLIAGWWDINNYRSDYLDIQSHTYDMHQYGSCGKGQLVCANYEDAKADLQKSLDIIKDNTSFCYPFYNYDNEAVQAIKDLGFKIAFGGGNVNATRNSNKYVVPRYPIQANISLQQFINIVN